MRAKVNVALDVAAIANLPRQELAERWQRNHGSAPSSGIRTELMARSAAWHLQAKHLGGFSAETRRLLRSAMAEAEAKLFDRGQQKHISNGVHDNEYESQHRIGVDRPTVPSQKRRRRELSPGARLMRDWNGRTHVVDVIEGGYVFEAKVYPSLTKIAETITGVHWSGPRFFGL